MSSLARRKFIYFYKKRKCLFTFFKWGKKSLLICIIILKTQLYSTSKSLLKSDWPTHTLYQRFNPSNPFHTMPHFDAPKICYSCGKHFEKRRNAFNKQFLFFSRFPPSIAIIFHFRCSLKCRLQFVSIWTRLKFCRLVMG